MSRQQRFVARNSMILIPLDLEYQMERNSSSNKEDSEELKSKEPVMGGLNQT